MPDVVVYNPVMAPLQLISQHVLTGWMDGFLIVHRETTELQCSRSGILVQFPLSATVLGQRQLYPARIVKPPEAKCNL